MPLEQKLNRCEPGSPNQCEAIIATGQCHYQVVPGFKFCPMHAGQSIAAAKRASKSAYEFGKWQAQIEKFTEHESIKSLRAEVGVLSMLLSNVVSMCEDNHALLLNSSKIGEIVDKIHRLKPTMEKMEANAGITLDKDAVLQLADVIVTIISDFIEDPDDKTMVADRIIQAIVEAKPKTKE